MHNHQHHNTFQITLVHAETAKEIILLFSRGLDISLVVTTFLSIFTATGLWMPEILSKMPGGSLCKTDCRNRLSVDTCTMSGMARTNPSIHRAGLNGGVPMGRSTQIMKGSFRRGLNSEVVTFSPRL